MIITELKGNGSIYRYFYKMTSPVRLKATALEIASSA
jgi:hypothetical protein